MTTDTLPPITPSEGNSGEWANLAAGAYRAVLDGIEDVGVSELYPADGPRFKLTFALLDYRTEDGNAITMFRWCSQKLTTGKMQSNLWTWAEALGHPPTVGQPFSPSALLGAECQVVIEHKKKGDGTTRPQIGAILPPLAAPVAAAAPTPIGARAPLAERLDEAAPAADPCSMPRCTGTASIYSGDGDGFCEKHQALAAG